MKKLILSLACATLVSSAFAADNTPLPCNQNGMQNCQVNPNMPPMGGGFRGNDAGIRLGQGMGPKAAHKMAKKLGKGPNNERRLGAIMSEISMLNLSDDQWAKIRKIIFDANEAKLAIIGNFDTQINNNGEFDKAKFVELETKIASEHIKSQANTIEALINVLDKDQKLALAKKINDRQNFAKNRGGFKK